MEQFDMEKLEKAIIYVDRIADGKNPVTNVLAEDDLVMNDPNIIRCMFFIKEALKAIKDNGGFVGRVPEIKKKDFPVEKLASFKFEENKTITKFVDQMNEGVNGKEYYKITFKVITNWLKKNGYLEEVEDEELGKKSYAFYGKGAEDWNISFAANNHERAVLLPRYL